MAGDRQDRGQVQGPERGRGTRGRRGGNELTLWGGSCQRRLYGHLIGKSF